MKIQCNGSGARLLAAALGVLATAVVGGAQVGPTSPETVPAQRAGWWVRVEPATQANRVYWRFGLAANELGAPMAWEKGTSPDALDVPSDQRMAERLHVAALGLPPAAPVVFCVFFAEQGVARVEFSQERNLELDRAQTSDACIP